MPGRIVRAVRILCVEREYQAEAVLAQIGFSRPELIPCHIGGRARIWSEFRIKDDGFGRLLVSANGTDTHDFTRLLQRLRELGNCLNKALLGLPIAHELDQAESRILPAVRNCAALTERERQLSLKAAQHSSLLRARIDHDEALAALVIPMVLCVWLRLRILRSRLFGAERKR